MGSSTSGPQRGHSFQQVFNVSMGSQWFAHGYQFTQILCLVKYGHGLSSERSLKLVRTLEKGPRTTAVSDMETHKGPTSGWKSRNLSVVCWRPLHTIADSCFHYTSGEGIRKVHPVRYIRSKISGREQLLFAPFWILWGRCFGDQAWMFRCVKTRIRGCVS